MQKYSEGARAEKDAEEGRRNSCQNSPNSSFTRGGWRKVKGVKKEARVI